MSMNLVPGGPPAGSGGPPSYGEPDRRLTVLATRFDTILPTPATRHDAQELPAEFRVHFAQLRAEILKLHGDTMTCSIGLMPSFIIGMLGLDDMISAEIGRDRQRSAEIGSMQRTLLSVASPASSASAGAQLN